MRFTATSLLCLAATTFSGTLFGSPIVRTDIIVNGPTIYGQGFGEAPRMLTTQSTGNNTLESGCVGFAGGTMSVGPAACAGIGPDAPAGGDEPNPHGPFPKFGVLTIGSLGYTNASQLEILFNATEPGKTTGLTMSQLVLKIYDPTGTLLLVETLATPGLKLSPTVAGNGRFDYSFGLNAAGIAALNSNIFNAAGYQNYVIALETTISDIHGGPESFVMRNVTGGIGQVPEPGSMLLLSAGLIGLALLRRRR